MPEQKKAGMQLPPPDQVGIVVRDLDKAVEFYSSAFGWGPFQVHEVKLEGCIYKGQPGNCRLRVGMFRQGPVEIELIQVLEGETPHTEFLKTKGEGLQHLRFRVDGLEGLLASLADQGIEPVFQFSSPRASLAYVNSNKIGGIMFELLEMK